MNSPKNKRSVLVAASTLEQAKVQMESLGITDYIAWSDFLAQHGLSEAHHSDQTAIHALRYLTTYFKKATQEQRLPNIITTADLNPVYKRVSTRSPAQLSVPTVASFLYSEVWFKLDGKFVNHRDRRRTTRNVEKTLSFRAECRRDLDAVLDRLDDRNIPSTMVELNVDCHFPAVEVEMTTPVTVERFLEIIDDIPDINTIKETIKACSLKENDLKGTFQHHKK